MILPGRSPLEFMADLVDSPEPPCLFAECTEPARWAYRCPACRDDRKACDEHRKSIDLGVALVAVDGVMPAHFGSLCQAWHPIPIPWRPI